MKDIVRELTLSLPDPLHSFGLTVPRALPRRKCLRSPLLDAACLYDADKGLGHREKVLRPIVKGEAHTCGKAQTNGPVPQMIVAGLAAKANASLITATTISMYL